MGCTRYLDGLPRAKSGLVALRRTFEVFLVTKVALPIRANMLQDVGENLVSGGKSSYHLPSFRPDHRQEGVAADRKSRLGPEISR